jgi:hypothetical protein
MSADSLIVTLHGRGISLSAAGGELHWHGPKGVMSPTLLAELKSHKPLILVVMHTLDRADAARDWEAVREWVAAPAPIVPRHIASAGARIGFPYSNDLWPEAYTRFLRSALRVRGVLRALTRPRAQTPMVDSNDAASQHASAE